MENQELKKTIETLLFITEQPLTLKRLCDIIDTSNKEQVAALIKEIQQEYEERGVGIQVVEIADGFQMASRSEYAQFVRKLYAEKMTMRLSAAALETLSIIAYKQPLTRAEIEEIRGVEVIAALETLLDKHLVRVVGRRESVGRPLLYGTTPDFMRHFGLRSIEDLPPLDTFTPPPAEAPVSGDVQTQVAVETVTAVAEIMETQTVADAEGQLTVDAESPDAAEEPPTDLPAEG